MAAHISFNGRLTDNPEFNVEGNGPNCKFAVAVDQYRGPNRDSDAGFYDCAIWTGIYKFMQGTRKGDKIGVWGELMQDRVERDGGRRTFYTVKVREVLVPDTRDRKSASGASEDNADDGGEGLW